ncbi:MAG: hypothetical protein BWY71_01805 [Planctomycetes bacterium ADurb.Bin412]|nr:MAG: hypothetical protein BWY71_01805 [Planctomycetes bacterium ADurb.Bin412]
MAFNVSLSLGFSSISSKFDSADSRCSRDSLIKSMTRGISPSAMVSDSVLFSGGGGATGGSVFFSVFCGHSGSGAGLPGDTAAALARAFCSQSLAFRSFSAGNGALRFSSRDSASWQTAAISCNPIKPDSPLRLWRMALTAIRFSSEGCFSAAITAFSRPSRVKG